MGEAKRRGTYEQRKAEGEARLAIERRVRQEAMAQREAAMTPEERASRRKIWMMCVAGQLTNLA